MQGLIMLFLIFTNTYICYNVRCFYNHGQCAKQWQAAWFLYFFYTDILSFFHCLEVSHTKTTVGHISITQHCKVISTLLVGGVLVFWSSAALNIIITVAVSAWTFPPCIISNRSTQKELQISVLLCLVISTSFSAAIKTLIIQSVTHSISCKFS